MTLRLSVADHFERLIAQEDTDGDRKITIRDDGPKAFRLAGKGGAAHEVRGTYPLSNLLQALAQAREDGLATLDLDTDLLTEPPVRRISRMIRTHYWHGLTRRIDAGGIAQVVADTKGAGDAPRIYAPPSDPQALAYYRDLAAARPDLGLQVIELPDPVTPAYVRGINDRPGILSLALRRSADGRLEGVPFVVPGGRFNEMYGWDSYFIALGLLHDGLVELARGMVDHFVYEITHYGQILNANRSYYLTRSQPPFLTAMALAVYRHLPEDAAGKAWLHTALRAAATEYETVWLHPRRLTETGLSRYCGSGLGMPPETEESHYDELLAPYAHAAGLDVRAYRLAYLAGRLHEPELDAYFVHDRAVRESGHDTSNRLEGRCAHLNTVDLNALLYRYEVDLADAIEGIFGDAFEREDGRTDTAATWRARAAERKKRLNDLCWNEAAGMFFDYDVVEKAQTGFEAATTFYPLWAGLATPAQAEALVEQALPRFEVGGGVVATTEASRGAVTDARPQRQWDYPFGWAPHQVLAWEGLARYGYREAAERLASRWLRMMTVLARDFNGTVTEKYDVVRQTHDAFVEYGNVGAEFDYITKEGFGWTNAAYQVGLTFLSEAARKRLEEETDFR